MSSPTQAEPVAEQRANTDQSCCATCERQEADARTARIRALNDALRTEHRGGMILMSPSVVALTMPTIAAIFMAIAAFRDFNSDNDPYGEHDCACLEVGGLSVIWKNEAFDRTLTGHSPDPSCPWLTVRVMTVMLASE